MINYPGGFWCCISGHVIRYGCFLLLLVVSMWGGLDFRGFDVRLSTSAICPIAAGTRSIFYSRVLAFRIE